MLALLLSLLACVAADHWRSMTPPMTGRPGGSHPRAPTERSVTVSRHSALLISIRRRFPSDSTCSLVSSQTAHRGVRLLARTNHEMNRPLRSTPITGASPLLRAGPPADAATVLNVSGIRR